VKVHFADVSRYAQGGLLAHPGYVRRWQVLLHERSTRRAPAQWRVGLTGFAGDRVPWWKRRWVVLECQPLEPTGAVLSYSHRHIDARAARAWQLAGAQLQLENGRLRVDLQGSKHR
jgi:hypothetical protein